MTDACRQIRSGLGDRDACATHGNVWPCQVRALALSRPWTELVLAGIKPVENRSWQTPYHGTIVIHGAKSYDDAALAVLGELSVDGMLSPEDYEALDGCALHRDAPTGYLGVVDVVDCHHSDDLLCVPRETSADVCSDWAFAGSYHWRLANPRRFPQPLPGRGMLGLFVPPEDLLAPLRDLIWEATHDRTDAAAADVGPPATGDR